MTEQHSVDGEDGATKNGQQDVVEVTGESAHFVFDDWCTVSGTKQEICHTSKKGVCLNCAYVVTTDG